MESLIKELDSRRIDYHKIGGTMIDSPTMRGHGAYINIIIGVRGRKEFIPTLMASINGTEYRKQVNVTFVEHAHKLEHQGTCNRLGADYIGVQCKEGVQYNRGLAFNVGVLFGMKTKLIITHDVDCIVQRYFFNDVLVNALMHNTHALQTFNKRRVLYCDAPLSQDIIANEIDVDDLTEDSDGVYTCKGEAPGGSIFLTRDLFFKIGGYDPELFTGYAPEDQLFWNKMSLFDTVHSCDDPPVEIFHLHHPFMGKTNPRLKEMIKINDRFNSLSREEKLEYVAYKRELIKEWE